MKKLLFGFWNTDFISNPDFMRETYLHIFTYWSISYLLYRVGADYWSIFSVREMSSCRDKRFYQLPNEINNCQFFSAKYGMNFLARGFK